MDIQIAVITLFVGIAQGMLYFVIAVGLSWVFSICNILNLAHGSILMIGAFLCWTVISVAHFFWLGLFSAALGCAFIGVFIEMLLLRPIYRREHIYQFILTFALIYIIQDSIKMIYGAHQTMVMKPAVLSGGIDLAGMTVPSYLFFVILVGILIYVLMSLLVSKTKWGRVIRAVTVDRDMARALGVSVDIVVTWVFALSCFLAGLGAGLISPLIAVNIGMDLSFLISSFIIIIIGGIGSIEGCLVGALVYGIVNSFGIWVLGHWSVAIPYALLVIVLAVRPWGLLGKPIRG